MEARRQAHQPVVRFRWVARVGGGSSDGSVGSGGGGVDGAAELQLAVWESWLQRGSGGASGASSRPLGIGTTGGVGLGGGGGGGGLRSHLSLWDVDRRM